MVGEMKWNGRWNSQHQSSPDNVMDVKILTYYGLHRFDEMQDVGEQKSGYDTWLVNSYFECSMVSFV